MSPPEDLFQNILSSLNDGIFLVSEDLNILKGNLAVEEMFRRSHEFFEGWPVSEFFPDQPQICDKISQTIQTGTSYHDIDCRGVRSNEKTFPARLNLSPYTNSTGKIMGAVLLIKDSSLLRELEETSRQIDYLSTIGELALGMVHEIRNPLGGIRASAQLLRQELTDPEQREYLEVVISEVDRINRMMERMMGFTESKKMQTRPINIHKVLRDIVVVEQENLAQKKGRFVQMYDPSLPQIEANEDLLKQVFLNLIKNAIEATPQEGEILLATRVNADYASRISGDIAPRKNIVVEITDRGQGIEPENLPKLFTPFYTTKAKGSGLGLPISLKVVEDHHGTIKIHSQNGSGTTAQVLLPVKSK